MNETLLLLHVALGVACILASVWLFAETLHAGAENHRRIKVLSCIAAAAMWASFFVGGYWYVNFYPADKAIILKGPWPFAHNFFMETKEHLVILLLLAANFLPIAARNNLALDRAARKILLWASALVVLLALGMEGEGALIAMGRETRVCCQKDETKILDADFKW